MTVCFEDVHALKARSGSDDSQTPPVVFGMHLTIVNLSEHDCYDLALGFEPYLDFDTLIFVFSFNAAVTLK